MGWEADGEVVEGVEGVNQAGASERDRRWARDWQFYATPKGLADRAVAKFTDKRIERVLDACAGAGALSEAIQRMTSSRYGSHPRDTVAIDVVEIDARHHPILRDKGLSVVGLDFLGFEGGAIYSHVIMNPPFNEGVKHVLKAFDMLWSGEVVAIINAETLRNPLSVDRRRLVGLVEKFGSAEFIEGAFEGPDVDREAVVEIAIVHLTKPAEASEDWIGPIIDGLRVDRLEEGEFRLPTELALPNSFVQNQCTAFRQAVKAMRESVRANAVAAHFAARIGKTMAQRQGDGAVADKEVTGEGVRNELRTRYLELKDRAWASVMRSTETLTRLSRKVQQQAEAQFKQISCLEFTEANVWGFLHGLVASQPEMQVDMCLEVFDSVTMYHADNCVFYKGWMSNSKHRTCGMRMRTTRFILPGHRTEGYQHSLRWESEQMLADFDKVWALLDGKQAPTFGLVAAFRQHFNDLRHGKRVDSDYFSVRYYPGAGTIHFFARDRKLVDRLNRLVGAKRGWLPPETDAKGRAFWEQFERAEKFDGEFRKEVAAVKRQRSGGGHISRWDDPIRDALHSGRDGHAKGCDIMAEAMDNVLERHGLLEALTHEMQEALAEPQLPLLEMSEN